MAFVIANSDPVPLTDVFRSILVYAIWAQLVGIPVAWLRVRKLEAWKERPEEDGHVKLLSKYMAKVTGLIVSWAALVSICVVIGSRL